MTEISLVCAYEICAAHKLSRPEWTQEQNEKVYGKCAHVHGHQYRLELLLNGEIQETGMLINEFDAEEIVMPFLNNKFDHKYLNEDDAFFKDNPPTAEWIAVWVYRELNELFPKHVTLKQVKVYETPTLAAVFPHAKEI